MANGNVLKDKWVPVSTVDFSRRKPKEWAKIYNVQLLDVIDGIWSEYEWAYNFSNLKYYPLPDNNNMIDPVFERAAEMELRALELRRDIFMGADIGERHLLETKNRYIETEWVKRKLTLI